MELISISKKLLNNLENRAEKYSYIVGALSGAERPGASKSILSFIDFLRKKGIIPSKEEMDKI